MRLCEEDISSLLVFECIVMLMIARGVRQGNDDLADSIVIELCEGRRTSPRDGEISTCEYARLRITLEPVEEGNV